jgi:hypothetical protein
MLPDPGSIPPPSGIIKKRFPCSNLIDNITPARQNIILRTNAVEFSVPVMYRSIVITFYAGFFIS